MRIVLQRVARASVTVDGAIVAAIGRGVLLLVGVEPDDGTALAEKLAQKCAQMRIFPDDDGRFNRSLLDAGGEALVVSQFTLLADARRGNRPSFTGAALPEHAAPLVESFAAAMEALGVRVGHGVFGASMQVELVNDGPVTIVLDSADLDRPRR